MCGAGGLSRERREVFLWNLRCIAGIRRWQEVLRRLRWCLKMGVCSALVQENLLMVMWLLQMEL